MKPKHPVAARMMGQQDRHWVPFSLKISGRAMRMCRTLGQKAVVHALLVLWQQEQATRGELSWRFLARSRSVARALDIPPQRARRIVGELVTIGVLEDTGERGKWSAAILQFAKGVREGPPSSTEQTSSGGPRGSRNKAQQEPTGSPQGGPTGSPSIPPNGTLSVPPSKNLSALPYGQSRAEREDRPKRAAGIGRTQMRLRLFAQLPGGLDPEAKELLEKAESGEVDEDWLPRAESTLRRLKGGKVEERGVVDEGDVARPQIAHAAEA